MGDHGRRCFDRFRIDRASACVHRPADASEVTIRTLSPEDRESFLAGFEGLCRESRYLRFFTGMPRLPDSMLQRLLNTDGTDHGGPHAGGREEEVEEDDVDDHRREDRDPERDHSGQHRTAAARFDVIEACTRAWLTPLQHR
jgi:hypothetical protein